MANLSDCAGPQFKLIELLRQSGRQTAKGVYGARGWVAHTVTNPWGYTAPGWGLGWGIYPTAGIWLADTVLVRNLFTASIESARVLGVDAELRGKLETARNKLQPLAVGKHGQLQEWRLDHDEAIPNHRHACHLVALYPCGQISPRRTPGLAKAAQTTIERHLAAPGFEDTEFTRAMFLTFFARLGQAENAYEQLLGLLGENTFGNMLCYSRGGIAGAPSDIFILDGNMAGAAGIAELLLQSHAGEIELLPALPKAWPGGDLHNGASKAAITREGDAFTHFKQDFTNIKFGDLAAGHYSRTRKESLLRGLRGLLESQALVRRLAPDVANEVTHEIYWGTPGVPCDLAILKCAALYHIPPNDYSGAGHWKQRSGASAEWDKFTPADLRAQLIKGCMNARERLYAHRGLPLEGIEYYAAATVNWQGSLTPEVQDRQVCSWLMGAPLLYSGDLASLTEDHITRYRNRFDTIKRLERTYGIYRYFQYSGVPAPTDNNWHWWGKLNGQGCGAVVVLRGSGGADSCSVNIPWVDPAARYTVTALFDGQKLGVFTGTDLRAGKLSLVLPPLGQEILELSSL